MNATITAKQMKIARLFSLAFMFAAIFTNHFIDFVGFFVIAMTVVLKERKMEKEYKAVVSEVAVNNSDASAPVKLPIRNNNDSNVNANTFKPAKVTHINSTNIPSKDNVRARS